MKFFKAPKEILAGIMIVTVLGTLAPFGSFADNQKSPVVINGEEGAPVYKGFIEIVNNVAIPDTVTFKGLKDKDTVFVYGSKKAIGEDETIKLEAGDLLAKATAKKTKEGYEALVSIKQQIQGDSVWVSLAEYGKKETEKIEVTVPSEDITQIDYVGGNINKYFLVHNNVGIADEVEVKNPFVANKDKPEDEMKPIPEKTLISIYDAEKDGKELGKGTVKKDGTLLIKLKDQLKENDPKD